MGNPSYFAGNVSLLAPLACTVDSTPPTFAGITGLVANANGSLTASWSAATDASPPVEYSVYVQASTATGLFATTPIQIVKTLSAILFTDSLGTLINGTTYYVGVRAKDAIGNTETNTVSANAVSQGVPSTSLTNLINGLITTIGTPVLATVSLDINSREPAADPKLLNLDATISSRLAAAAYTAPDNATIGTINTNVNTLLANVAGIPAAVWGYVSRTLTAGGLSAADVWDYMTTSISTVGSIGLLLKTNVDALISSRASQISMLAIPTNPLLTNDGRLNNLDASISSVNTAVAGVNTIVLEIQEIEKGRWKIVGNQMIFYKMDNVTEIFRCNLFGQTGNPTMTNVFERVKV